MLTGEPAYLAVKAAADREQDTDVLDEATKAFNAGVIVVHEADEMCCELGWWHPGRCPGDTVPPCPHDEHRWRSVGNVHGDVECVDCGTGDNLWVAPAWADDVRW